MQIVLERMLERYPDFALAVPEADLRWTKRVGLRALRKLPVDLGD